MAPRKEYIGKVFGKLTVNSLAGKNTKGEYLYLCICECGEKELHKDT